MASNLGIVFSTGSEHTALTNSCGDAVIVKPYRLTDIIRGLQIVREMADLGGTTLDFPRNFRLLTPEPA